MFFWQKSLVEVRIKLTEFAERLSCWVGIKHHIKHNIKRVLYPSYNNTVFYKTVPLFFFDTEYKRKMKRSRNAPNKDIAEDVVVVDDVDAQPKKEPKEQKCIAINGVVYCKVCYPTLCEANLSATVLKKTARRACFKVVISATYERRSRVQRSRTDTNEANTDKTTNII